MFAGGMTLAVPGFLPQSAIPIEAYADQGTTNGMLYVSSTELQGAQVLQIIVDDPSLNKAASNDSVTVDVTPSGGTTETIQLFQVLDGSYHAYITDDRAATAADAISSTSLDFGTNCNLTLDSNGGTAGGFVVDATDTWIEGSSCTATGTTNSTPFSALQAEPPVILAGVAGLPGPAAIANVAGTAGVGMVIGHWGLIYATDWNDDNLIEYGSDSITVTYGPEEAGSSITSSHDIVVPGQKNTPNY